MDLDHFNDIIYASGNLQTSRDEERERTLLWHFVFCSPFFSVFSFFFFLLLYLLTFYKKARHLGKKKIEKHLQFFFLFLISIFAF